MLDNILYDIDLSCKVDEKLFETNNVNKNKSRDKENIIKSVSKDVKSVDVTINHNRYKSDKSVKSKLRPVKSYDDFSL